MLYEETLTVLLLLSMLFRHNCRRRPRPFLLLSPSLPLLLSMMSFWVSSSQKLSLSNKTSLFPIKNGEVFRVFRIFTQSWSEVKAVQKLSDVAKENAEMDFWLESAHPGQFADVMVSPEGTETFERFLAAHPRLHVEMTVDDVQKLIVHNEIGAEGRRERKRGDEEEAFVRSRRKDQLSSMDNGHKQSYVFDQIGQLRGITYPWGQYTGYNEMVRYMRTLEFYYPHLVQLVQLGSTHEGRSIEGVKIGYNGPIFPQSSNSENKPKPTRKTRAKRVFWIDGNMHAREWASGHTALFIINQLVWAYEKDPFLTNALNHIDFVIVPCTNPDGFEYSRSSVKPQIRLWRKNRSPEQCSRTIWGGIHCCRGVDLNRNFDFHWAETGSSLNACSNLFAGKKAFSEPEAKAIANFLQDEEIKGRVDAFITLHTYAQLWIHPFSHEYQNFPNDVAKVKSLALSATARLREVYGINYKVGTGADLLAPASGGSDDWAKQTLGVKFVYLVELRPQQRVSNGFILRQEELLPTAIETFEGIKVIIQGVLVEKALPFVPLAPFVTMAKNITNSPPKSYSTINSSTTNGVSSTTAAIARISGNKLPNATLAATAQMTKTTNLATTVTTTTSKTTITTTTTERVTETTGTEKRKSATGEVPSFLVSGGDEESQSQAAEGPAFQFISVEVDRSEWGQNGERGKLTNETNATKLTLTVKEEGIVGNETSREAIVLLTTTTKEAENESSPINTTSAQTSDSSASFANSMERRQSSMPSSAAPPIHSRQFRFTLPSVITRRMTTNTPKMSFLGEIGKSDRQRKQFINGHQNENDSSLFNASNVQTSTKKTMSTTEATSFSTKINETMETTKELEANKMTAQPIGLMFSDETTVLNAGTEHEQRNVQIDEIDASPMSTSTFSPLIRIISAFKLNSDNFTEFDVHQRGENGTLRSVFIGNRRGKQNGGSLGDYWRALFAEDNGKGPGEGAEKQRIMTSSVSPVIEQPTTTDNQQKCRDERSSCSFWIRAHRLVCTEQMRYMRRNCALSCGFCSVGKKKH